MEAVYFIDENDIKQFTAVNLNVETQIINVSIQDAQTYHIQPLLGSNLFKTIKEKIIDGTINDVANVNYKNLLDNYIYSLTIAYSVSEIINYLSFKLVNKGVVQQSSDNSTNIDNDTLKYLQERADNKAEMSGELMRKYLVANATLFPEYQNYNSDDISPVKDSYFCGIEFDINPNADKQSFRRG